jgi:hypothetical protein
MMVIRGMDMAWPIYQFKERSSGPVEQQLYLLLTDRGEWMTGHYWKKSFSLGMTEQGRERFSDLLNGIRFKRDCRDGKRKEEDMSCTVNGKDIYFTQYGST